jgi:alkaline phosphatase D
VRDALGTDRRIAFGSCNKQGLPQTFWPQISSIDPLLWLWLGDAAYTPFPGTPEKQRVALEKQRQRTEYSQFASSVRVEGVYDDHDFGPNDCGKNVGHIKERQTAFLDFIGAREDDPRRFRDAIYSSHTIGEAKSGMQVKVIFLDVRTHRDPYPILNMETAFSSSIPGAPIIMAVSRLFRGIFCIRPGYQGDVLGEEQWSWLEDELRNSKASVNIIVSTMQVFTVNPIVESWLHFAAARDRLVDLLQSTKPHGFMFLSGDIHTAEIISGTAEATPPVEVTTSGLTHSGGVKYGRKMTALMSIFSEHRTSFEDFYVFENWGSLEMVWSRSPNKLGKLNACNACPGAPHICQGQAIFRVHAIKEDGKPVLQTNISTCDVWALDKSQFWRPLEAGHCQFTQPMGLLCSLAAIVTGLSILRRFRKSALGIPPKAD